MTVQPRTLVSGGVIAAVLVGVCVVVAQTDPSDRPTPILYSQLVREVELHQVDRVKIKGDEISGVDKSGARFTTVSPTLSDGLLVKLETEGVKVEAEVQRPSLLMGLIQAVLPILLLAGLWILIMRQMTRRAKVSGKATAGPQSNPDAPQFGESNSEVAALQARIDDQALLIRDLQSALKKVDAALDRATSDIAMLRKGDAGSIF